MKHKLVLFYLLFLLQISFDIAADDHEATSEAQTEVVDTSDETVSVTDPLEATDKILDPKAHLIKSNADDELDTENTKKEKSRGPAVGYVPESAVKQFKAYHQNKQPQYDLDAIKTEIYEFERQQEYEKSIELLSELNNKAGDTDTAIHLTQLLLKTEKFKQAEVIIKPLCHKEKAAWQSCFYLGTAQLMSNQLNKAAESLDRALLLDVEQAIVWQNRAIIEQERNDHHAAIQLLSIAHNLSPTNSNVVLNLALSNEAIGNHETAFQFYKQFLQLTKNHPEQEPLRYTILERLTTLKVVTQ